MIEEANVHVRKPAPFGDRVNSFEVSNVSLENVSEEYSETLAEDIAYDVIKLLSSYSVDDISFSIEVTKNGR